MKPTEQQIQERAKQIGDRPYHPVPDDANSMYRTARSNGISIRFELMRTAMGGLLSSNEGHVISHDKKINLVSFLSLQVNTLLLEMARQELGVGDE
jgi:flagellar motor switch/type III secretory pathway protein FliN